MSFTSSDIIKELDEQKKYEHVPNRHFESIVQKVNSELNNNIPAIILFWFDSQSYNLLNFNHTRLLSYIFRTVGTDDELVIKFLNNISDKTVLYNIGIIRSLKDGITRYRSLYV